ncbi:MAG: S8 family serine peptidase [Desulfococcaceae bacterium]
MFYNILNLTIFFFLLLCTPLSAQTSVQKLDLRISGDRLSIHADQAPLQSILRRIAAQGIRVQVDPDLNPEISASFEKRKMEKGLHTVLKSLDYALIWESQPGNPEVRLAEIQIFEPGRKSRMRPLETSHYFKVVRNPENGQIFVKDEILMRPAPGVSRAEFEKFLKSIGGIIVEQDDRTGVYRIRLPENTDVPALIAQISGKKGIATAEPNYAYPILLPYRNISPDVPAAGYVNPAPPENGVRVAVLDSGLLPGSGLDEYVAASLDAVSPEDSLTDGLGHGTQMALIASGAISPYGVSSGENESVPIIPIRVFDDNGVTTNFSMMRSIDFALENGAKVLSMSWGSDTRSDFLEQTLNYADEKGLILVAAAGNEATGKEVWPAAYSSVMGVGALAPDGTVWENSNYGSSVTVSAPGFASLPVGYKGEAGAYAGTSIATAYVANSIARYLSEHPDAGKEEVFKSIDSIVKSRNQ